MKIRKLIGLSLLITALFVILGMCLRNLILWSVIDILVIIVCSSSGVFLIYRKNPIE
jgi:flagellar motor component MotA